MPHQATIGKTVNKFKKEIEKLYHQRLKQVILYGSWARGEATTESDIDLLIVLDGEVQPGQEIDRMIDIITEINLSDSVLLSVYPISQENFVTLNNPLLLNVRREGVPA